MGYYMILFCVCVLCCSTLSKGVTNMTENKKFPASFYFGDSIFDSGNNNQLKTFVKANFPPYGQDFKGGIPTGRFCNGRIISDFMADKLGIKEYVPAYLDPFLNSSDMKTGVSFASGGSGYDPLTSEQMNAISMLKQLEFFKEYINKLKEITGEEEANDIIAKSVYLIEAGSFDLSNYYGGSPRQVQYSIYSYADLLVYYASSYIQELYTLGAKNIAVINAPSVGCTPAERTALGGPTRMCAHEVNQGATIVNEKLYSEIKSLKEKLSDEAKLCYIDLYKPILDIVKRPESYGFEVVRRGCCGTGLTEYGLACNKFSGTCSNHDEYFFWDAIHGTERGFEILAEFVYDQFQNCFPDDDQPLWKMI